MTSLIKGKLLNAGQICTAPDVIYVERSIIENFLECLQTKVKEHFPKVQENDDYTSIINHHHITRLQNYINEIPSNVIDIYSDEIINGTKLNPTIVINPPNNSRIMNEEIFGPIFLVKTFDKLDNLLLKLRSLPKPLALYINSENKREIEYILKNSFSGGVTINDTLLHYTQESLPFGGVGDSGIGSYHGKYGFDTFSHHRPVFVQSKLNFSNLLMPPYNKYTDLLLNFIIRMS